MMKNIIVVAPHPDDETLGCGGTLLRHIANGDQVDWLIVTDMHAEYGYSKEAVAKRQSEIKSVTSAYPFRKIHNLGLPPARLDVVPKKDLVVAVGQVLQEVSPATVYLPFRGDVHTDHSIVFDVVASCTKWFRYPSIRRVLCYETLSETDFGLNPEGGKFAPNAFVDITSYMDRKIKITQMYEGEIDQFPSPRSVEALRALAQVRGAVCGCQAAESFMLLREINT